MTYSLLRVQVGELVGTAVPDCEGSAQPFLATLRNDDDGTTTALYGCFDSTAAPCEGSSLLSVIIGAGYELTDDPCGEE